MSWRAGFFRFWIFLSIIWVLLVVTFSYDGIVNPWVQDRAFALRATLAEIRSKKLPEYNGLSDEQFADAVYRKFYADLSREEFDAKIAQAQRATPAIVEEFSPDYKGLEELVASGEMTKIPIEGVPRVFMFYGSDHPMEARNRRLKEVYPLAVELRNKLVHEKRVGAIWGVLGAALVPPFVLLLVGAALAWVIAGFRRPPRAAN